MTPIVQGHHGSDRFKNWLASVLVALPTTLLLALPLQIPLSASGLISADRLWSNLAMLMAALFLPCLWLGAQLGPTLIARYDDKALRPAPPEASDQQGAATLSPAQQTAWEALESWCKTGSGTGCRPFCDPSALPEVTERFSVAVLTGIDLADKSALIEAFARYLDRNDELDTLSAQSRLKGLLLKLTVKWHELWWWQKRHPRQPWDCGYLIDEPAAITRLTEFNPRRPTLIIANNLGNSPNLAQALQILLAAKSNYRHPVRLLLNDIVVPSALAQGRGAGAPSWQILAHN